jgi:hypothetical protein
MNLVPKYYVYEWIRPDYDVVFWVGKGSGKRAWKFSRNPDTNATIKHLANKGMKPEVRIIARFLKEKSALAFEVERIAFWKPLGELTNKTDGGEGVSGDIISGDNNPSRRPDVIAKRSGATHYTKREGYIHPLKGKNNNSAKQRCLTNNPSKMPGVNKKQRDAWTNDKKELKKNVVTAWWTEERKIEKSKAMKLNPSVIPLEKRKAAGLRASWYNTCVMHQHYWGA